MSKHERIEIIKRALSTLPEEDYKFPLYVIVEPTSFCNLSCIMCPYPQMTREKSHMPFEIWQKIIDEIASKSPETILWPALMGEASITTDIFLKQLQYANKKNVRIRWNTNGTLLTESFVEELEKLEIEEITVGIDAFSKEAYNQIRIGGDFTKVIESTCMLINKLPKTRIVTQMIVMDQNAHEVDDFKKFWLSKGASVKIRAKLCWGHAIESGINELTQEERFGPCPWLMRTISIHQNGAIVQCDADWNQQHPYGNIQKNSIEEIWQGKLKEVREQHRQGIFTNLLCQECADWQAGLSHVFHP